jgi:hypothetical protein
MERDIPMEMNVDTQPLEIDIRKILEQLGIQKEKWPEEYKDPVEQS